MSELAGGCPGLWAACISVRKVGRVTNTPLGPGLPAGLERPTTAGRGTGSSPGAVSTQVTGRGALATTEGPPRCVPGVGARLRGRVGSWVGLRAARGRRGASGRPCFHDVAGA